MLEPWHWETHGERLWAVASIALLRSQVLVTSVTRIGGLLPPSRDRRSQRSRHPVNPLEGKLESRRGARGLASTQS